MLVSRCRLSAAAAILSLAALCSPAKASLVPLTTVDLTGQGLGAATTLLALDTNTGTESGYVTWNGSTATAFGNAKTGNSQFGSFTLPGLGVTDASQIALIVNLSQPDSQPSVTTALASGANANLANNITLNVFSASGSLLGSFDSAANLQLNQVNGGVGGSGIAFHLDSSQADAVDALMTANPGNEVFTAGATFTNAAGGLDVIQVAPISSVITSVPEPATWAMMFVGFACVGLLGYRRRSLLRLV